MLLNLKKHDSFLVIKKEEIHISFLMNMKWTRREIHNHKFYCDYFEPVTPALQGRYSTGLNYRPI